MPSAIIYAAGSKSIRRVVIDDDEAKLAGHVGPGEGIILVGRDVEGSTIIKADREAEPLLLSDATLNLAGCKDIVERVTGQKPADARCVVLGVEMKVAAIIMADPLLDDHPAGFIVREPDAVEGDELKDDGEFYRGEKTLREIAAEEAAYRDALKTGAIVPAAPGAKG